MVIDIQQILERLPHRYPFLLVDRVLEFEQDKNDYYQDLELLLKPFKIINASGISIYNLYII